MVGTQPTVGVKGSKPVIPRFKSAKEQIPVLSEKYLRLRNRAMSHKAMEAEWNLAVRRGQLIEKSLVERQASFLLISLRQKLLNFPAAYARRILNLTDVHEANRLLKEMMLSLLNEIRELPQKVVNPNWLEALEKDEDK